MSKGAAILDYCLPLLCRGTHAFFPLPPQVENAADIFLARMYNAPRPSNSVLATPDIILVQMYVASSERKIVSGGSRKGRSKCSERYCSGARDQFIYQGDNVLRQSDFVNQVQAVPSTSYIQNIKMEGSSGFAE